MEELLTTVCDGVSGNWKKILLGGNEKNALGQILAKIAPQKDALCPAPINIFNFARLTPFNKIKIIIIGQDPYHTPGIAHGLAFSSLTSVPPSLRNIYLCLQKDGLIAGIPRKGDLSKWATQGVLLLNTSLTTVTGRPGEHIEVWAPYIRTIITKISNVGRAKGKKYVFLLWGSKAQSLKNLIDCKHHVALCAIHPSPMAQAHAAPASQFINCGHFAEANKLLDSFGEKPIKWDASAKEPAQSASPASPASRSELKSDSEDAPEQEQKQEQKQERQCGKIAVVADLGAAANKEEPMCAVQKTQMEAPHWLPDIKINTNCGSVVSDSIISVFTDGATLANGKSNAVGGYAAVYVHLCTFVHKWTGVRTHTEAHPAANGQIIYGRVDDRATPATNIRSEGAAILAVLNEALATISDPWTHLMIFTDSEFWKVMIYNYMPHWSEYDFQMKKNPDMTIDMWQKWNQINLAKKAKIIWVPGHNKLGTKDSEYPYEKWCYDNNECADRVAGHAVRITDYDVHRALLE
jgi:uracil-DNA glycosylase